MRIAVTAVAEVVVEVVVEDAARIDHARLWAGVPTLQHYAYARSSRELTPLMHVLNSRFMLPDVLPWTLQTVLLSRLEARVTCDDAYRRICLWRSSISVPELVLHPLDV